MGRRGNEQPFRSVLIELPAFIKVNDWRTASTNAKCQLELNLRSLSAFETMLISLSLDKWSVRCETENWRLVKSMIAQWISQCTSLDDDLVTAAQLIINVFARILFVCFFLCDFPPWCVTHTHTRRDTVSGLASLSSSSFRRHTWQVELVFNPFQLAAFLAHFIHNDSHFTAFFVRLATRLCQHKQCPT